MGLWWDLMRSLGIERDKEERREREKTERRTKEGTKRRKEKEKKKEPEKRKEPEPVIAASSSDVKGTSGSSITTSLDLRVAQPKTEVLEETSAMAQSDDPPEDKPKSWEYEDPNDEEAGLSKKIKHIADKSVRRVRKISSSTRSKRDAKMTSRPIKEKSLDRFMERVKARHDKRIKSAERVVHDSECVFPDSADVVRAESIVAKKDDVAGSREKSEKSEKRKDKGSKEGVKGSGEGVSEKSEKSSRRKEKGSKEGKSPITPEDESTKSKRKGKSPKKKEKEKKEKEKKEDDDESFRSARSEKSERSTKSSRRKNPLKQIQKIFPDLSKKGRQERREKNEAKKREKEETIRRKNREKNMFVNGRPFWMVGGKMSAEEKAEMTQDDLPLNAAIILEVKKGNIDLPVLPNTVMKFDRWAPLEVLQAKDETLFNHKMLFANTIRSMINSADYTGTDGTTGDSGPTGADTPPNKEKHEVKRPEFEKHPEYFWNYDRAKPGKMWREAFKWEGLGVA